MLAKHPVGISMWHAVWKVVYDDGDTEQLSRVHIVAAMRLHGQHIIKDTRNIRIVVHDIAGNDDMDEISRVNEGIDVVHVPMLSTGIQCLHPRYNLLELLTLTATQNRLSYLVELVLGKSS